MIGRFEWHITCPQGDRKRVMEVVDTTGWTFSEITGCPILGQGTYCYITGFDTDDQIALHDMIECVDILETVGVEVLRSKIENIVYDSKTKVNMIGQLWAE